MITLFIFHMQNPNIKLAWRLAAGIVVLIAAATTITSRSAQRWPIL